MPTYEAIDFYRRYRHLFSDNVFMAMKSSTERLEHILTKSVPIEVFRQEVHHNIKRYGRDHIKSETKSKAYREDAQKWFNQKEYQTALNMCHRVSGSRSKPFETTF